MGKSKPNKKEERLPYRSAPHAVRLDAETVRIIMQYAQDRMDAEPGLKVEIPAAARLIIHRAKAMGILEVESPYPKATKRQKRTDQRAESATENET